LAKADGLKASTSVDEKIKKKLAQHSLEQAIPGSTSPVRPSVSAFTSADEKLRQKVLKATGGLKESISLKRVSLLIVHHPRK